MDKFNKQYLILPALLLIVLGIFFYTKDSLKQDNSGDQDQRIVDSQAEYAEQLKARDKVLAVNGLEVDKNSARPLAVIVENHVDSRPQSGLSQADLVYETLAEGGITRFLAIYQTEQVNSIGPVRSARTYFNDWAEELGAIYAHVGGNSDALDQIKKEISGLADADQFFNDPYFTRISSRIPPHNTYTSTAKLESLVKVRQFDRSKTYPDWKFKDEQPTDSVIGQVTLNFSLPSFQAQYKYDSASNSYLRYQAGKAAIDAGNNKQITAKNIIVQTVRTWSVQSDTPLAISMGTRESGKAYFFLDGRAVEGTWKYENNRTRYYHPSGNEMEFNRGKTWIAVLSPEGTLTFN